MSSSGGSWRVAGRLARREVRRHPWRHLLVTVLILVPVLAALAAFSVITTWGDVDARQESFLSPGPEYVTYSTDQNARSIASTDLELPEVQKRIGLPKGTPTEVSWSGSDWLLGSRQRADKQGPLLVSADMIEAPDRSLRASEFVVSDGRLPAREGEIFVTDAVARKGGWSKGDTWRPREADVSSGSSAPGSSAQRTEARPPPSPTYRRPIGSSRWSASAASTTSDSTTSRPASA